MNSSTMLVTVVQIFAFIISGACETEDYFEYSDCDFECTRRNISCMITEINLSYFPCECLVETSQCVSLATDDQVCLRPGASALGGSKIWPDFSRHRNATTTTTTHTPTTNGDVTTTPSPTHTRDTTFIFLTVILAITNALTLAATAFLFRKLRNRTTANYSQLPSNEIYQETVQNNDEI